ncbi:Clr5 domain-containing protein [Chaetomium sp. MPI-CAGE-AT-0009]|nr:Clr5 domain-containing protein [Chaetomium sp. MPI-CAGE-AT-0009]
MTKQWDKYREVITAEYKDQNKPLHEVQRFMAQKYGFRASTRAYRSRFDRWRIHKYSRRRGMGAMSPSRRASVSDGGMRPSPRQSPDMDEGSPQAPAPAAATSNGLFPPGLCVTTSGAGFRSSLCLVKPDFPYTPITPSPSPALAHGAGFSMAQYGCGLAQFGAQNIGCYPPNSVSMYRQGPRDVMIVPSDASGSDPSNISMGGMPNGYGYSLGLLTGQE